MSKLKPCPFCGGEAQPVYQKTRYGCMVYVECSVCEARTKVKKAYGDPNLDEDFWEQFSVNWVKDLWNKRSDNHEA